VPVPRRFDRRPPERDTTRINERIRVPEVRLIGEDGSQIGVLKIDAALRYAQTRDLDLVEVAPEAKPPVCRVLDYSKYKYEQAQKLKQARKHQQQITIREIKFRPKIAQHDYDTKKGHVERFLKHKDKVKVTIMFRGREVTHPERGVMILDRLAEELAELAIVEQRPIQDGRNMTMMLGPSKAVLAGQFSDDKHGAAEAEPTSDGAGAAAGETQSDTGSAEQAGGQPAAGATAPQANGSAPADAPTPPAEATGTAPAIGSSPATGAASPAATQSSEAASPDTGSTDTSPADAASTDTSSPDAESQAPAVPAEPEPVAAKPAKPAAPKPPVPAAAAGKPVRGKRVSVEPADELAAIELEPAVAVGTRSGAKPA
jgi:translation initiation factor IF-3